MNALQKKTHLKQEEQFELTSVNWKSHQSHSICQTMIPQLKNDPLSLNGTQMRSNNNTTSNHALIGT